MKFRQFLYTEDDPTGGTPGTPPIGSPPNIPPAGAPTGSLPPPIGGAPPMGGDPMGGGVPPMGGGAPAQPAGPPVIPQNADVWDVLDAILHHKPLQHDKDLEKQKQQNSKSANKPNNALMS